MNLLSKVLYNKLAKISKEPGRRPVGILAHWCWHSEKGLLLEQGLNLVIHFKWTEYSRSDTSLLSWLGCKKTVALSWNGSLLYAQYASSHDVGCPGNHRGHCLNLQQVFPRRAFSWDRSPCRHLAYSLAHSLDCDMACPRWAWLAHRLDCTPGSQKFGR